MQPGQQTASLTFPSCTVVLPVIEFMSHVERTFLTSDTFISVSLTM